VARFVNWGSNPTRTDTNEEATSVTPVIPARFTRSQNPIARALAASVRVRAKRTKTPSIPRGRNSGCDWGVNIDQVYAVWSGLSMGPKALFAILRILRGATPYVGLQQSMTPI